MRKKILLLPFLIPLFLMTNCANDTLLSTLTILETRCSDPWGTTKDSHESEIQNALTKYLKQDLNVPVIYINTTLLPISIYCPENNCSCITTRQISVTVEEGFVPILEDNGFELID